MESRKRQMLELLQNNICNLYYTFPDGSKVHKIGSLNKELLEEYGVSFKSSIKCIIDLETGEEIPNRYVAHLTSVEVYNGENQHKPPLSKLDEFLSKGLF